MFREYRRDPRFENKYCSPHLEGYDGGGGGKSDGDIDNALFDKANGFTAGQWYWYGNTDAGNAADPGIMSTNISQFIKYASNKNVPVLAVLSEVNCTYCDNFMRNVLRNS